MVYGLWFWVSRPFIWVPAASYTWVATPPSACRSFCPSGGLQCGGGRVLQHLSVLQVGFNVEVGGYFSIKRNTTSISMDTFISREQVVPFCMALLEVFR
jgi:Nitrite and sulphite reductase 4Fe-4S domain